MRNQRTRTFLLAAALSACLGCGSDGTQAGSSEPQGTEGDEPGQTTDTDPPGPADSRDTPNTPGMMDAAVGDSEEPLKAWRALPNAPRGSFWNHDDVYFVDESKGWVCDISGTIWHTNDGGDNWAKQVDQEGTSFRALAFLNAEKGFVGTLGPGSWVDETQDDTLMYGTSDGGKTWTRVTNIQGGDAMAGVCGLVTVDEQTIYGVGRYDGPAGFIKTTDGGKTWVAKKVNEADGLVDLHFFNASTGLLGGRRGGRAIILRTTDGGETFTTVSESSSDHIWKLYFLDDQRGYAMISNYARNKTRFYLKTEDAGLTWSEVHYSPPVNDYEGLGIGFVTKDLGWAAGGDVTYETRDGGKTFTPINLDPEGVDTINRFFRVNDTMYAAGARIYKYDTVAADSPSDKAVDGFDSARLELSPTPFNGHGTLSFTVPESGPVSIGVVGIGGRLIEPLVAETKTAGTYVINYRPEYNQKSVRITMLAGERRKSVGVVRLGGGEYPRHGRAARHTSRALSR